MACGLSQCSEPAARHGGVDVRPGRLDLWQPMTMSTTLTRKELVVAATTWTVAEAKARLSEVIERAQSGGPQTITKNGRTAVVVVDAEEWERKTKRSGNLAEFFAASPLRKSGLKIKRAKDGPRKVVCELPARHQRRVR